MTEQGDFDRAGERWQSRETVTEQVNGDRAGGMVTEQGDGDRAGEQ